MSYVLSILDILKLTVICVTVSPTRVSRISLLLVVLMTKVVVIVFAGGDGPGDRGC